MYVDRKSGRVLLRNGVSMVDSFSLAKKILSGEVQDIADKSVMQDFHSLQYDYLNKSNISAECSNETPTPTQTHQHNEDDLNSLIDLIMGSDRFDGGEAMTQRVSDELEFFERTNNIIFIIQCVRLLERFKKDGIIWGVGRGSSCASLIFYLLYITDIDPLCHNIKFSELSKEM